MKKLIYWPIVTLILGCSSAEKKDPCPSVEEEPISVCRAREKCRNENSSVGVGLGIGMGNFGFGVGRSQSSDRYANCLDEDLLEQRERAKASQSAAPAQNQPNQQIKK